MYVCMCVCDGEWAKVIFQGRLEGTGGMGG